ILNGSPLFTGGAGSGESEIRRYLLQNDLVEAIVALPTDMFYNTRIATYGWVLSNHKVAERQGKVPPIDRSQHVATMRKSRRSTRPGALGAQSAERGRMDAGFDGAAQGKLCPVAAFACRRVTVARRLRLNCQSSRERSEKVRAEKASQNMTAPAQQRRIDSLR